MPTLRHRSTARSGISAAANRPTDLLLSLSPPRRPLTPAGRGRHYSPMSGRVRLNRRGIKRTGLVGFALLLTCCSQPRPASTMADAIGSHYRVTERIVFVHIGQGTSSRSGLKIVLPDGSSIASVFSSSLELSSPRWSPAGTRIAFVMSTPSRSNVFLIAPDGSRLRQITRGNTFNDSPAWSPDGRKLAFSSDRSGNFDIWVKKLGSPGQTPLASSPAIDVTPDWSPDGGSIAFASNRGGRWAIWVEDLSTGSVKRLTPYFRDVINPRWSPDGSEILFAGLKANWQIFLKRIGHAQVTPLTSASWVSLAPTWSTNGREIAFDSDGGLGGHKQVYVLAIDGQSPQKITDFRRSDATDPDWGSH